MRLGGGGSEDEPLAEDFREDGVAVGGAESAPAPVDHLPPPGEAVLDGADVLPAGGDGNVRVFVHGFRVFQKHVVLVGGDDELVGAGVVREPVFQGVIHVFAAG